MNERQRMSTLLFEYGEMPKGEWLTEMFSPETIQMPEICSMADDLAIWMKN